jgi:hypothetical protein
MKQAWLAFQLGEYAADEARVSHPDFPFVLRKLQARADTINAIGRACRACLCYHCAA